MGFWKCSSWPESHKQEHKQGFGGGGGGIHLIGLNDSGSGKSAKTKAGLWGLLFHTVRGPKTLPFGCCALGVIRDPKYLRISGKKFQSLIYMSFLSSGMSEMGTTLVVVVQPIPATLVKMLTRL